MNAFLKLVAIAAVGGFSVATTHAGSITILNPGFENPNTEEYIVGTIADWDISGVAGVWKPSTYYPLSFSAYAGNQAGFIGNGSSASGTVSQVLSATLQPNTRYDLGIYIGGRPGYLPGVNYSVKLFAGSTELAAVTQIAPQVGEWVHATGEYTSGNSVVPGQLSIVISDPLTPTGSDQLSFDNVSLTTSNVPDGGTTLAMLGGALTGLAALRRKLS